MPKWTAEDLPSMAGKTLIVTGATSGLGLITARELARVGARVVLAVRDTEKGRRVLADMTGDVQVQQLDVSDLGSVRAFAARWSGRLDVLINNAGVMDVPLTRSNDGLDHQTATNSFGPFLLTDLLLPHITDRVVWVTSQLHRMGRLHLEDLNWERRPYKPMAAYSDSKLQVVLYSLELQRRLSAAGSPVRSVLAHPGIATTPLAAHSPSDAINRFSFLLNDPQRGALPTLYAATQDLAGNAYVGPDGLGSVRGYPEGSQAQQGRPRYGGRSGAVGGGEQDGRTANVTVLLEAGQARDQPLMHPIRVIPGDVDHHSVRPRPTPGPDELMLQCGDLARMVRAVGGGEPGPGAVDQGHVADRQERPDRVLRAPGPYAHERSLPARDVSEREQDRDDAACGGGRRLDRVQAGRVRGEEEQAAGDHGDRGPRPP